ncbi:MAG TPA: LPS export ABC transporter permease LptF [Rhizobiaceae bacterium]|nr:LPS export ABC transporter permease LptF [Rhizobiaceae bacterium]
MRLIERYIFKRTFSLSMLALVSTTVMVLITQVLIYVNVLTTSGQAIGTFFTLAATLVPSMINIVLPFALFIGASQTLNTMNTDSELAVIEASGGSPTLTARPVMILAIMLAVAALLISLFVEPWADRHKRDIIAKASADLISVAVQSGNFQRISRGLYLQVSEQLPSGDFAGVFIADSRDRRTDLIYYAKRGSIRQLDGTDILALEDGEVHRKTIKTGDLSIIRFQSYVVDLSQFTSAASGPSYDPTEQDTYDLLYGDQNDDHFKKFKPEEVRAELNRRFSDWLYPIAFGMIAVLFGARASSNREERIWGLTAGAALAIALRGLGFYFMNNSGTSAFHAGLSFAVPVGTILVVAALMLTKKSFRISGRLTDTISGLLVRLMERISPTTPSSAGQQR